MYRFGIEIEKLGGTAITPYQAETHANIPRRVPGVHRFHDNDGLRCTAARGVTVDDDDDDGGGGQHNRARAATTKKTMNVSFGLLYYYFRSADYRSYIIYIYGYNG